MLLYQFRSNVIILELWVNNMSAPVFNVDTYEVDKLPPSVYYIPNFITEEDETFLLTNVQNVPKPKWTCLSNRRLQNWGGLPHPKGMVPEKLPQWLTKYMNKVASLGVFGDKTPNHVLVNEYLPGQGIMPHEDGPLFYPTITTVNLGSHSVLDYYHPFSSEDKADSENEVKLEESSLGKRYLSSVLLEPRSLLIVQKDMYHCFLHGIKEIHEDLMTDHIANLDKSEAQLGETLKRKTRISLTIRHVPKTLKVHLRLGLK